MHADLGDDPFDRPDSQFNTLKGWSWIGCYGGYYLQANHLQEAGLNMDFSPGAGMVAVLTNWPAISLPGECASPQQVHGAVVLEASATTGAPWPEADGVVSDRGGQSLWVCGADCTLCSGGSNQRSCRGLPCRLAWCRPSHPE